MIIDFIGKYFGFDKGDFIFIGIFEGVGLFIYYDEFLFKWG